MRAPLTQEEQDYRANFSDRVTAISNVNGLFSDIEDKARRLTILKSLITNLHLGDEIVTEIDKEITAAKEAAKKAAAEEDAENKDNEDTNDNLNSQDDMDLDLAPMPNEGLQVKNLFANNGGTTILTEDNDLLEDQDLLEADNLPTPEEADDTIDFTENK